MDWVKRNLVFVIVAVITLLLMGFAGWYSYSGWSHNAVQKEEIGKNYEELNTLYNSKPAPGDGKKVDNIKLAKEQQQEAREFTQKLSDYLQYIPSIPGGQGITLYTTCVRAGTPVPPNTRTNVAPRDFSAALQETIAQLLREATNSSVMLPPKYKFSFEKQSSLVTFTPGTVEALATQLGEVKAICEILNSAKINSLDAIRRERIPGSPDDLSGPATDYLTQGAITNELAIISPYEVTFRSFTPELAEVLNGFAASPYSFVVKAVNVEPAPASIGGDVPTYQQPIQPIYQQPGRPAMGEEVIRGGEGGYRSPYGGTAANRYGAPGANPYAANPYAANPYAANRYAAAGYPAAGTVAVGSTKSGLQTLLQEKQLKVTLLVHVVKRLPLQ